jgi:hypothetical protein
MIVYCKEEFYYRSGFVRQYDKYKCYQSTDMNDGRVFVYTDIKTGEGLWINKETFDKYFTYDKKFMRKQKLERIIND